MKIVSLKVILSFLLLTFSLSNLRANHVAGADISYQQVSSGKFKVTYRIYRLCKELPLSTPDFNVSCDDGSNTKALTVTRTMIRDVSLVCSKDSLPCNPANTSVSKGMEEQTFEVIVDFNQAPFSAIKLSCCKAIFSLTSCCRNGAVTNITPGVFYLDAMVDLCLARNKGNSSPVFKNKPILNLCCNNPFSYNNGAIEVADGDSISFESSAPLKGINDPETYSGSFSNSIPMTPYCPPNPGVINCTALPSAKPPRGLFFDPSNGDIVLTPTKCDEVAVINFKVLEWRRDSTGKMSIVGYVKRESTWFVQICSDNAAPYLSGNNKFSVCEGNKICFTVNSFDDPNLPNQTVSDTTTLDWDSAIAGASFRIIDPNARVKSAEICWQTKVGDARVASYRTTVNVKDDYCPQILESNRIYTIQVKAKASDTRTYKHGIKGMLIFEAFPSDTIHFKLRNYTYSFKIKDSSNSGTPLYSGFVRKDSFKFTNTGTYIIEHQINNPPLNCPTTYFDTIIITTQNLLNILQNQHPDFRVFPNPSNGEITFSSSDLSLENLPVKVFAIEGKLVADETIIYDKLDLSYLCKGIYTLQIKVGELYIFRKLIIE